MTAEIESVVCVFSQYQYGKIERGLSTEYEAFFFAFKEMGVEVDFFDTSPFLQYSELDDLNESLILFLQKRRPKVAFFVQWDNEFYPDTLDQLRSSLGIICINWCTDDSWRFREHSLIIGKNYDLMITTEPSCVDQYSNAGINASYESWGYSKLWQLQPRKSTECSFDVVFIGTNYFDRKDFVRSLKNAAIDVQCFGFGWDNTGNLKTADAANIYNNAKIVLNFSKSNRGRQMKARTFEVMASGTCLLSEQTPGLECIFGEGTDFVTFDTSFELVEKVKYLLQNPNVRDEIAFSSYKSCVPKYAYVNKLRKYLNQVETPAERVGGTPAMASRMTVEIFWCFIKMLGLVLRRLDLGENTTAFIIKLAKKIEQKLARRNYYSKMSFSTRLSKILLKR